jgi:hypothetical protein
LDGAKGEQRVRLVSTRFLLSGEVERLARVLPSLVETSCEEVDGAEHSGE